MAICKFCGQRVSSAPVFHPACWDAKAQQVAERICEEYCKFPERYKDDPQALEVRCADCDLVKLINLGL